MKVWEGNLTAEGLKIGIVVARFNDMIGERLLGGAMDAIKRHGGNEQDVELVRVPGAFEIPLMAKRMAATGRFDAIIALGAVIRGETPHFEYVSGEVTKGVAVLNLEFQMPVIFGVLTVDTIDQAANRAGLKSGNKGFEAAVAAIEMANLNKSFQ
ncbi:6,7-dimethyl-8-ribityllumazine synthase [Gottschalkiaceae bacterium SANA]|nr:6,7-dimethyl-8-ribityllumazine synthase [Gottschalkiaceae bacterium SANA]